MERRGKRIAGKDQQAVPFVLAEGKNPEHAFAILAAKIRADVEDKWQIRFERGKFSETRSNFVRREDAIRITEPKRDDFECRLRIGPANQALCVGQGGSGDAGDRRRAFKSAHNPALKYFAGRGGRAISRLAERTAHGKQIMSGYHHRDVANRPGVHRIGMIADVNERGPLAKVARERDAKENKLVQVGEPLRDEAAGKTEPSQEGPWSDQLCRHSGGVQSLE